MLVPLFYFDGISLADWTDQTDVHEYKPRVGGCADRASPAAYHTAFTPVEDSLLDQWLH